jgi:hypothetical protein
MIKNNKTTLTLLALLTGGATALVGCGNLPADQANGSENGADVGSVSLALQLSPGVTVSSFAYSITGPTARAGNINVSNSTTASALVSGLSAGPGYAASLSGTASDGTTCSGTSGAFAVSAGSTTHDQRLPDGRLRQLDAPHGHVDRPRQLGHRSGRGPLGPHVSLDGLVGRAVRRERAEPDAGLRAAGPRDADARGLRRRRGLQRHVHGARRLPG